MIALEIHLNGQRLCLAGAADLTVLHASVGATGTPDSQAAHSQPLDETRRETEPQSLHFDLRVDGIASRGPGVVDRHLTWCTDVTIGVGDTVTVRLMDIDPAEASAGKDCPTADVISEKYEKYLFERAKKTYLALREKYGDGSA